MKPSGKSFTLLAKKQKTSWLTKCAMSSFVPLPIRRDAMAENLSAASLVRPRVFLSALVVQGREKPPSESLAFLG